MKISIEDPLLRFDEHLILSNNNRIFFSGKFGTGKSHFLKEYFGHHKDKYSVFFISPVNYVVGANQDIFEWIKVDIAERLLRDYLIDNKEKTFSKSLIIQTYIYNNPGAIINALLTRLGNLLAKEKTGIDVLDAFKNEISTYKKFEKAAQEENKSHFEHLQNYINTSSQIKGSIREDDLITQIIRASIEWVKYKEKKEVVLVIDDLDRLDPEHIFRILNILSAHNNHFDNNKFGFQKVIIVCDIDNIQHMYEYRYGPKSDFDGYIEKFYSYTPFNYSFTDAIIGFCNNNFIANYLDDDNKALLALLLIGFFEISILKIRNLKKIHDLHFDKKLSIVKYPSPLLIYKGKNVYNSPMSANFFIDIDYQRYKFLHVLYILSISFGGVKKLEQGIIKLRENKSKINTKYYNNIINSLLIISHISKNIDSPNLFVSTRQSQISGDIEFFPPITTFLKKQISLNISCFAHQNLQYQGGHYFVFNSMAGLVDTPPDSRITSGMEITWNTVGHEISTIIQLIKRERFFENV